MASSATTLRFLLQNRQSTERAGGPPAAAGAAMAVPGVHDALSARIFASNDNIPVLFLSGFGVSACRLGQPDAGILTLSEMEDTARSVLSATCEAVYSYTTHNDRHDASPGDETNGSTHTVPPPVIVDGDTGYGNVRRTIRSLAAAGAAAVTIEDQVYPKKCTFAAGTGIKTVEFDDCVDRIRAAIVARDEALQLDGNDVLLVARTDCRMERGLEEAVRRCLAFRDMGADIVYAENLQSRDEYIYLRSKLGPRVWTMLAQLQLDPATEQSSRTKLLDVQEIGEMGYDLALFGVSALQVYVGALQAVSRDLFGECSSNDQANVDEPLSFRSPGILHSLMNIEPASFNIVKQVVGFDALDQFEARCYDQ